MRIRFKKWARPELEESKFYIDEPEKYKGKWRTLFENNSPLYVELGCGKGGFISQIASENPNIDYIAIDLVDAMLGLAKRNIEEVYAEKNEEINNVLISRYDIDRILNVFDENDKIDRIYINFCNPWPRGKHHKKRLTHTRQLEKYKQFLVDGGKIYFKTGTDEKSYNIPYWGTGRYFCVTREYGRDQSGQSFCKRRGNSIICFRKWK
jgi:tRNA (guanine-N7-)-methyltransferase